MLLPARFAQRKKLLLRCAIVGAALLLVVAFLLRGTDFRSVSDPFMTRVRHAGPWAFFTAMALFPAAGFPMSVFSLTAGPVFADQMGVGAVAAAAVAAATINLLLTYWLARRALRPWLTRLLERLGYRLPQLESGDLTDLIVILRVTPGIPFFVQNYLLGVANAPFIRYLAISCPIIWSYTAALILFGDALLHGKARVALLAASLLIAVGAATHLARRHYAVGKAG